MSNPDFKYMVQALKLAQRGQFTTDPNPAVGCVLVKDQRVIAEGWTQRAGQAHAEVHALSQTELAAGATAYVTLEPCNHQGRTGPCTEALIQAGVVRVVIAMHDPNPLVSGKGVKRLLEAGIEVESGVLEQEAKALNRGFFKRMQTGLPWVRSKLAMSLDGRTALANGTSQWITSAQSRSDVHQYRAASSAVLTGISTVLVDDPGLDARVNFDCEAPVKVILDSQLKLPVTAKVLQTPGSVWVFTTPDRDSEKIRALEHSGCRIFTVAKHQDGLDLGEVFTELGRQQINTVWIEAGAKLNASLLKSGLVDEWLFYVAPCLLGDQARGLFQLPVLTEMSQKTALSLQQCRQIGPDLRLTFTQTEA